MTSSVSSKCLLASGAFAVMAFTAAATPAAAIPDFSSNQVAWQTPNGGELIAVEGSPAPLRQDPAHPFVGNGRPGEQPTYRVADLSKADNLKQWAKDIMKKDNDEVLAGKIAYTARQSCKPGGVPGYSLFGGPFYFLQTPKEVTLIFDGDAQVRHVYLDVPHSANVKPSWYGESVGHYEGDTLVVDTIGLNTKNPVDNYRTPHTEKLHVVERYRLIDEGKTMELTMTIDDPDTYNQPWQAMRRYRQVKGTINEEVCAEGNFLLFDYGVPVANKPDF
jgi:hypothetical protein